MLNSTKDKFRKTLLEKRGQLTEQEQQEKSNRIIQNIRQSELFKHAEHIAFYHAVRGEADPFKLMEDTNKNDSSLGKKFYLPILHPDKNKGLAFAPINKDTQYKNNQFLIPEPVVDPENIADTKLLDIVIMPLLGFDLNGNRLGMGGGYYDRCFSFKKKNAEKPILIGFAYEFQQLETLETEPWDIGLDALATEDRFVSFT